MEYESWRYIIAIALIVYLVLRFLRLRNRFGSVRSFRKNAQKEAAKSTSQHEKELRNNPKLKEELFTAIAQHEKPISRKHLRNKHLHISSNKFNLLLNQLESEGKVVLTKNKYKTLVAVKNETQ